MKRSTVRTEPSGFLASLPEDERSRLLEVAQRVEVPATSHLVQAGETPNRIAFVESGMLAVSELSDYGAGRITVLAGPEAFAPVTLVSALEEPHRVEVWALVDSVVHLVDVGYVRSRLADGGALAQAILHYHTRLIQRLATDLQIQKDFNLLQRTAAALLELHERLPGGYSIMGKQERPNRVPVSHDILARRLGTVREVATESLGQLREEDYIETLYRKVEIVDAKGLRARAGGAYRRFTC